MYKKFIKIIAALLIFTFLFLGVQDVLTATPNEPSVTRIKGFYDLEENSLDAVFIGSSATYAFLNHPYGWNEYGIAVYPYATPAQSPAVAKYLIEETAKTQKNAVFIVNLTTIESKMPVERLHEITDNMPDSVTKYRLIYDCGTIFNYSKEEMLECVFPIIRYHERWDELKESDFSYTQDSYLAGHLYPYYLKKTIDATKHYDYTKCSGQLPSNISDALCGIMEYSQENNLKVLFTVVPQAVNDKQQLGLQNAAVELVKEKGFDVLDMRGCDEEIGVNYATDFYNRRHTNLRGSLKVTSFLCQYLMENYDLEDKRGDETYAQWDEAWDNYYKDCLQPNLTSEDMKLISNP